MSHGMFKRRKYRLFFETTSSEEETITPESIFSSPLTYITLLIGIIIIGIVTQKLYDQFTKSEYNIELEDEDDSLYVEDEFDEQTEMNDLEPSEEIEMVNENRVVKKKSLPRQAKEFQFVKKQRTMLNGFYKNHRMKLFVSGELVGLSKIPLLQNEGN